MTSGKGNHAFQHDENRNPAKTDSSDFSIDTKKHKEYEDDNYEDPKMHRYGWGSWRPGFLQYWNNPKGYLILLCTFAFLQGMVSNGLVFVVITTLERRFGFTSAKSGMIVSVYDFASITALIFVTYYGGRGCKPRYLGVGAFVFGAGSIVFALPHFLSEVYNAEGATYDTCNSTRPVPDRCAGEYEDLSSYYTTFLIAQIIHGLGATPLYTLGIAYLEENCAPKKAVFYIGVFQAVAVLGPALGFIFGGMILELYVDLQVDPDSLPIDSSHPLWIGAWWLGFLVCGVLNIIIAIPMTGFAKHLPGRLRKQEQREIEIQKGAKFNTRPGFGQSLKEFPRATWTLLKNPVFMFLTLAGSTELFIVAYVTAFAPKYFESIFNMPSSSASILAGVIGLPAGLAANLFTGWLIKTYDLKVPAMMKYMFGCLCLAIIMGLAFLWICPNADFAGVTVQYGNKSINYPEDSYANLTAGCNAKCNCERFFDPVCGSDNVIYYTACLAGCTAELEPAGGSQYYADCSCIPDVDSGSVNVGGTAVSGKCDSPCWTIIPFLIMFFISTILTFNLSVPSVTSTLRCVDPAQRSFALGLQVLIVKCLGLIPGPIAYGNIIDDTCLIWEQSCSGGWTCWMYDNKILSYLTVSLGVGIRFGSIIFMFLAMVTYRSGASEDRKDTLDESFTDYGSTVSIEQKRPISATSEVGVQADFPSHETRKEGSLDTTDL